MYANNDIINTVVLTCNLSTERLRQENQEFAANMGYIPCLKKKNQKINY
jgi:hypothetical protein